jgi:NADH dehydrogenase
MWLVIHIFYLVGFKNRVQTLFHWIVSFLGRSRTQRTGVRQRQPAPARRS